MRRAENFVILRRKKIEVSKPFYLIHDNYYFIHEDSSTTEKVISCELYSRDTTLAS